MLNPRAVLFDLDNTLYHWNPCDAAGRKAAHACLRTAADVDAETFLAHYRAARAHLRHVLRGQAASHDRLLFFQIVVGEVLGRPEPGLVLAMAEAYRAAFLREVRPEAAARGVLETLARRHALALISNHTARFQLEKVERLGFSPFFRAIVTSEEAGAEKPDPRVFLLALERLGVTPEQAVMVGDHPRGDIDGAHRLGIPTVHTREFTPEESPPEVTDHVITALAELPSLFAADA